MKRIGIAAVAALAMVGSAQAQKAQTSPLYGEIGLTLLDLDFDGGGGDATALRGVIGHDLNHLLSLPANAPVKLAAEAMLAVGITEASESVGFGTAKAKMDYSLGAYAKGTFNVIPELEVFGRLGLARTKVMAKVNGTFFGVSFSESATDIDTGIAYGLGARYNFNPRMSVGVDFMQYADGVDGITASFGYRF